MAGSAVGLVGFADAEAEEIVEVLGPRAGARVLAAGEVVAVAATGHLAVLCLGPEIPGSAACNLLTQLEDVSAYRGLNVVLAAGEDLALFSDLVARDLLYYLTPEPPPLAAAVAILRSAAEHHRPADTEALDGEARDLALHRVLEQIEGIARQASVEDMMAAAGESAAGLVTAGKGVVLAYDRTTETLWRRDATSGEDRRESAVAGLVSYVVRTGDAVVVDRLGDDPRYESEADNDSGSPDERCAAVPVDDGSRVWGVLIALRDSDRPTFDDTDRDLLQLFADQLAVVLRIPLLRRELEETTRVSSHAAGEIFREEALEHHLQGYEGSRRPLQMIPAWTGGAYFLLLMVLVGGLLFSLLGRVNEYASGPAVVRREGRTDVTASLAGTVVTVEVRAGEQVQTGQLLARLYGVQEAAELERIRHEFELGLVQRLRDPAATATERSLGALRAQKTLAERRLEERAVRAPHAGTVGDVWIQPGQYLTPGQPILTLDPAATRLGIVALVAGEHRPLIRPGQEIRLEIVGYSYAYQQLKVETVGQDVVGPAEARRFLGPGIGDAVPIVGAVVLVTASLPSATFESAGRRHDYHEGILGTAEIRIRDEPVLLALVPGLRALWEDGDG